MPTQRQCTDHIDTWWTGRAGNVLTNQIDYASTRAGRYFQGLKTHLDPVVQPDSGVLFEDILATNLLARPTDQTERWLDVFAGLDLILFPAQMVVDVYQTPAASWGYVVKLTFQHGVGGPVYSRHINNGPETRRDKAWFLVIPDDVAL